MIYLVFENCYLTDSLLDATRLIYVSHDREKADKFRYQNHEKETSLFKERLSKLKEIESQAPWPDEPTSEQQDLIFDIEQLLSVRYKSTIVVEAEVDIEISKAI